MDFKTEIKEEPLFDSKEELLQQNFDIKCESDEDGRIQLSADGCVVKLRANEAPGNNSSSTGVSLFNFKVEPQLESSSSPSHIFTKSESIEGFYGESDTKMCNNIIELPEVKSGICSGGTSIHLDCSEPSSAENQNKMAVLGHLIPIQVQTLDLPPGVYPINSVNACGLNLRENSSKQFNSYFQCPENLNSTEESVVESGDWVTEPNVKEELQEQSHQCGESTKKFNAMDELEEHMPGSADWVTEPNVKEELQEQSHQCGESTKKFNAMDELEEPMPGSADWVTEPNVKEELQEQSHQCGESTNKVNAMDELEEHMPVHSPHVCTICFRKFESARELNRHIPYHRKIKSRMVQCPHCPEQFRTRATLKTHLLSHNDFSCAHCSRTFSTQAGIEKHWKTHLPKFPCPLCTVFFRCESELTLHFAKSHSLKNPMYNCAHCTEKFDSVEDIKNHLEVHF